MTENLRYMELSVYIPECLLTHVDIVFITLLLNQEC
jgi:hypothetical protein